MAVNRVNYGSADLTCGNITATNIATSPAYTPTTSKSGLWYPMLTTLTPATLSMGQNTCFVMPINLAGTVTISGIGLEVTTNSPGASIRLGIYNDNGSGTAPGVRLVDFGTIDGTTAGSPAGTLTTITGLSQILLPGRHWLAAVSQGAGATVRRANGPAIPLGTSSTTPGNTQATGYTIGGSVSGALPVSVAPGFAGADMPRVMIQLQ